MRKIIKVEGENFQSWERISTDLVDGINVFVGKSNNGKTAILRLLKWVLTNKPSGKDFIRRDASYAMGRVHFSDGLIIERYRSNKENRYNITYPDGTNIILNDFGVNVPREVVMAHNMRIVSLGNLKQCINFMEQLEGPFLMTEGRDTPNSIAVSIGRVARTEITDRAIKKTSGDINSKKQRFNDISLDISELNEELENFGYLEDFANIIFNTELEISTLNKLLTSFSAISKINDKLNQLYMQKNNLQKIIDESEVYENVYQDILKALVKYNDCRNVKQLINKMDLNIDKLKACEEIIAETEHIDDCIVDIEILSEKIRNRNYIRDKITSLNNVIMNADDLKETIDSYSYVDEVLKDIEKCLLVVKSYKQIEFIVSKFYYEKKREVKGRTIIQEFTEDLKNAINNYKEAIKKSNKCPLCFGVIDDKAMENISNNLSS